MEGVVSSLGSNSNTGIHDGSIPTRQRIFGQNTYPPTKIRTICQLIMENFDDRINQMLLLAAIVSAVIGGLKERSMDGLIEPISICIALVIIISVGSTQNYIAEQRLAEQM